MWNQTFNATYIVLRENTQTLVAYSWFIHHVHEYLNKGTSHLFELKSTSVSLMLRVRCRSCRMLLTVHQMWLGRAELCAALEIQRTYCACFHRSDSVVSLGRLSEVTYGLCQTGCCHLNLHGCISESFLTSTKQSQLFQTIRSQELFLFNIVRIMD